MQSYGPRLSKWEKKTIKLDFKSNGEFDMFCLIFVLFLFIWCTVKRVRNVHAILSIIIFFSPDLLHTERTVKDQPDLMRKRNYFTSFRKQKNIQVKL